MKNEATARRTDSDCELGRLRTQIKAMDAVTIERDALSLTTAERALLADRLLQTLNVEDDERMERWGQEADRRLQTFERGEESAVDGPTAVANLRKRLE